MSITCKKAVDYIAKKEEGKISTLQTIKMWKHLAVCSLCRRFYKQNELIISLFKINLEVDSEKLSQTDKNKILQALADEEV